MRRPLYLVLALLALFLAGCSTLTDFAIVNRSGEPLTVSLVFRHAAQPPAIMPVQQFDNGEYSWRELGPQGFQAKNEGREIQLTLVNGQALRVSQELNYTGHEHETLDLQALKLAGKNGEQEYEGKAAQQLFRKQSGRYVVEYQ